MWRYNQGMNSAYVKTGDGADATETASALRMEQRMNRQGTELRRDEATIQNHEAVIQMLREQVQLLSTQQDRTLVGAGSELDCSNEDKLCGINRAGPSDAGPVLYDSDANLENQLEVNAIRTRQHGGRLWPLDTLTPEKQDNAVGSYNMI